MNLSIGMKSEKRLVQIQFMLTGFNNIGNLRLETVYKVSTRHFFYTRSGVEVRHAVNSFEVMVED